MQEKQSAGKLLINNEWIGREKDIERGMTEDELFIPQINPCTEEIIGFVTQASTEHVNQAIESSQKAFSKWKILSLEERAKHLLRIEELLSKKIDKFAFIESSNNGKTLSEAKLDIEECCNTLRYYASVANEKDFQEKLNGYSNPHLSKESTGLENILVYEPIGVCVGILPFNYPLLIAFWKFVPAILVGCTIILKPSEYTSMSLVAFGEILREVLPPGVVNILTGYGSKIGNQLTNDSRVNKVSFTGSLVTGLKVSNACSPNLTRCTLELGGKSPMLIFEDCDIEKTINWIITGIFTGKGEVCSATSRLLVQKGIYQKLIDRLVERVDKEVISGDSTFDSKVTHGAQVCKIQYDKIMNYIKTGKNEGATLLYGGDRPKDLRVKEEYKSKGYFVAPTIFTNVTKEMTIWKEEIFGPVLSVMTFETEEEAIELANATPFGLAASVMSENKETLLRVGKQLVVGTLWFNCSQPCLCQMPWPTRKMSGVGCELSTMGLFQFLELKSIITSFN
ncbi:hypothetical protein ABK040_012703 [Willaertia magna]